MDKLTFIIIAWLAAIAWAVFNVAEPNIDSFVMAINEPLELKVWHFLLVVILLLNTGNKNDKNN